MARLRPPEFRPATSYLSFDGREVNDMRRLPRLVAETPVGKTVPVTLWRKRAENTVQVKVGKLDESDQQQASAQEAPKKATPRATPGWSRRSA